MPTTSSCRWQPATWRPGGRSSAPASAASRQVPGARQPDRPARPRRLRHPPPTRPCASLLTGVTPPDRHPAHGKWPNFSITAARALGSKSAIATTGASPALVSCAPAMTRVDAWTPRRRSRRSDGASRLRNARGSRTDSEPASTARGRRVGLRSYSGGGVPGPGSTSTSCLGRTPSSGEFDVADLAVRMMPQAGILAGPGVRCRGTDRARAARPAS